MIPPIEAGIEITIILLRAVKGSLIKGNLSSDSKTSATTSIVIKYATNTLNTNIKTLYFIFC